MSRAIINKLLHEPTVQLRKTSESEYKDYHLLSLRHLFGLDEKENEKTSLGGD